MKKVLWPRSLARSSAVSKPLAAAAVAGALLASPATGSTTSARVKLAVVPLPRSAIGSVARPLRLTHLSGKVSTAAALNQTMSDATGKTFVKLGRVSGYQLDYGFAESGGSGVTAVLTGVEQYKTSAAARRGLAFWKQDDSQFRRLDHGSFSVTNTLLKMPPVGQARFAYLTSYSAPNIAPLSTTDERFREGKYVLQVQVSAGRAGRAKALAPKLAKKLDARLRQALSGRLQAKPVELPPKLKPGPPRDGPDLEAVRVTRCDLFPVFCRTVPVAQPARVGALVSEERVPPTPQRGAGEMRWEPPPPPPPDRLAGYCVDPQATSCWEVSFFPAGPFQWLHQFVYWYATDNQAAFWADWMHAVVHMDDPGSGALDLSSLGHGAEGTISGEGVMVEFTLNVGRLDEVVIIGGATGAQGTANVQKLAKKLTTRLDGVYTG